jgi:poly(A) polymerase
MGSEWESRLWIVGGYVRDRILGTLNHRDDLDLVLEGNSQDVAQFLVDAGVVDSPPVTYPRFGTSMVVVQGVNVEIVTAREESYSADSRKPHNVRPATLMKDALRRDFTINTLLENLHTSEVVDPLGTAFTDLDLGILRTPLDPHETFRDDPLRMLRAVRFSTKLGFVIEPTLVAAMTDCQTLLSPPKVSVERIRDEFSRVLLSDRATCGLSLMMNVGLIEQFAPDLATMVGVVQNDFHVFPVWEHTLAALDALIAAHPDSSLVLRLSVLLHDIGKPATRSVGADNRVHFYHHQDEGAAIAERLLSGMRYPKDVTVAVCQRVAMHMRIGDYEDLVWSDAAVRRFVRNAGDAMDDLFALHRADVAALAPAYRDSSLADRLQQRINALEMVHPSIRLGSPLTGTEIMQLLGIVGGKPVGTIKHWLTNEVLEGRIPVGDKLAAVAALRAHCHLNHNKDLTT